jgi:hypothetical protein
MLSLKGNLETESSKDKSTTKTKSIVTKPFEEKKDKDYIEMESL